MSRIPPRVHKDHASRAGGCNLCHSRGKVVVARSHYGTEVRICRECAREVKREAER